MHRSSSNTRVADEFYRNTTSYYSSPAPVDAENVDALNANLPIYAPSSESSKKDKSRLKFAENAVHLIPLVLLLCAIILWFFSNPVDFVNIKPDSIASQVEGLKAAGGADTDGTQHNLLQHMELEDVDLVHRLHHRQTTERKPSI